MTVSALTTLSEEEKLLRDAVLGFARERIAPHVARMDEESRLEPELLTGLFELGLMGIEIPESFQGAGGSFMNAILAVEALARVDASLAVVVDVQNTLVNNALLRWGNAEQQRRYLPLLSSSFVRSVRSTAWTRNPARVPRAETTASNSSRRRNRGSAPAAKAGKA